MLLLTGSRPCLSSKTTIAGFLQGLPILPTSNPSQAPVREAGRVAARRARRQLRGLPGGRSQRRMAARGPGAAGDLLGLGAPGVRLPAPIRRSGRQ